MKAAANSSPVPRSGGVSSFSCGFAIALTCLLLVTEVSISSGVPQKTGENVNSFSQTEVKWEIDPLLPKNFEEKKFVEANSEVPENPPDETNHFSFRDQQAAQPVIDPQLPTEQVPQIKGQDDTVKIVPTERESQATPALLKTGPEHPHSIASDFEIIPISTDLCLNILLLVSKLSRSSINFGRVLKC